MTEKLYADIQQQGLDHVLNSKRHPGNIALPRRQNCVQLLTAIVVYTSLKNRLSRLKQWGSNHYD